MTFSMLARIRPTTRDSVSRSAPPPFGVPTGPILPLCGRQRPRDESTLGRPKNLVVRAAQLLDPSGHGLVSVAGRTRGLVAALTPFCSTAPKGAPTCANLGKSGAATRPKWLTVEVSGVEWCAVEEERSHG